MASQAKIIMPAGKDPERGGGGAPGARPLVHGNTSHSHQSPVMAFFKEQFMHLRVGTFQTKARGLNSPRALSE